MNYTQLAAAIADLMHRTDLTASIPTFILLAEAELSRSLRIRPMEITLASTAIVSNAITLASDVLDVKSLWVPSREWVTLDRQPLESVLAKGITGVPNVYARDVGNTLRFNGGGNVTGVLYQKIPALTAATPTNWLATAAPDIYLYGASKQASIYVKEESLYDGQYQMAVAALIGQDNRYTGPMRVIAR